jgi:hypothetical protein
MKNHSIGFSPLGGYISVAIRALTSTGPQRNFPLRPVGGCKTTFLLEQLVLLCELFYFCEPAFQSQHNSKPSLIALIPTDY